MEYSKSYVGSRRILSFALLALVIGSSLGGVLWNISSTILATRALTKFSSEQELIEFLKSNPGNSPQSLSQRIVSVFQPGGEKSAFLSGASTSTFQTFTGRDESATSSDYSTTNIQVEGVDEADIVKTDGEYLYLASGSTVSILRAYPPEDVKLLSSITLNTTVAGLYVNGEKLVVFQNNYGSEAVSMTYYYSGTGKTSIIIYDISNRSKASLERAMTVDGSYFSSRMINDYVYVVVNKPAQVTKNGTATLPVIQSGNTTMKVAASNIYYSGLLDYSYYFTTIIAINVRDAKQNPTVESFLLGSASNIYVSAENIYLTSYLYSNPSGTKIYKIGIKDSSVAFVVSGNVSGYVLNQFSMDENKEYFRIATSNGKSTGVYVLDKNLKTVGKIEGLAPGETLHSARFMGDRCYLVTFKKTDPLFVIDLKEPGNPQVLGTLKIPGYSDYLHPYDETHLIGVGKETVESELGDFAWYQGVKISLFDVSNVSQPKEIDKAIIGDRGTDSPVLSDHKAFLFSKSKNLLVIPVLIAEIDPVKYLGEVPANAYGDYVWQGAYVYDITITGGLKLEGGITHLENTSDLMKSGFDFNSPYFVKRTLYIDDVLYTISDKMVKLNSLEDLKEIASVNLP